VNGPEAIPAVDLINVLVHGFNVDDHGAQSFTFPEMFKRLYWARHPVVEAQGAHTVGISWPGDFGFPSFAYFVEDELNALKSGIPVAKILDGLKAQRPTARLAIVAHSLGNMVVNSALLRTTQINRSDRYVMVQAAVAAEAFSTSYQLMADEKNSMVDLPGAAASEGYSEVPALLDKRWIDEWTNIVATKHVIADYDQCNLTGECLSLFELWSARIAGLDPDLFPKPTYYDRWSTATYASSPWRGLFASNVERLPMMNVHHDEDQALNLDVLSPWRAAQVAQKPHYGLFGLFTDGPHVQFWGMLPANRETGEESVWLGLSEPASAQATLARKWAELAFWFQPVSGPGGTRRLVNSDGTSLMSDRAVGEEAGVGGVLTGYASHTYLTTVPIWDLLRTYIDISAFLRSQ
jgi:hypothetical protein